MKKKPKPEYLVMKIIKEFRPKEKGVAGIMFVFTNKKQAQKFAKGAGIIKIVKAEE